MSASKALSTAPSSRQPSAGGARGAVTGGAKAGVDRRGAPSTAPVAGSRQGTFNFAYSSRQRRGRRARRRGRGRPCLSSARRQGCRAPMRCTLAAVRPWRPSDHRCSLSRCVPEFIVDRSSGIPSKPSLSGVPHMIAHATSSCLLPPSCRRPGRCRQAVVRVEFGLLASVLLTLAPLRRQHIACSRVLRRQPLRMPRRPVDQSRQPFGRP